MPATPGYYTEGPEALVVSLAVRGDREAFAELVRRRQPWIRNLMRRFAGEPTLADDLSQKVFLKAWSRIRQVKNPERFGPWLKRIAVNSSACLADTNVDVTDQALDACPVGALLRKREGYQTPVGKRLYDITPIGSDVEQDTES